MLRTTTNCLRRRAEAVQVRWVRWVVMGCVLAASALPALSQDRHALIIGNAAYAHVEPLRNSVNDADLIARSLGRVGFKVTLLRDATLAQMQKSTAEFGLRLARGDIAFVYFAIAFFPLAYLVG
ncbi:MAG: caspase family protein, partial [Burkholderiaceae bacterium]|nr:caspase family protein [Burkholderiaceae bacterium]